MSGPGGSSRAAENANQLPMPRGGVPNDNRPGACAQPGQSTGSDVLSWGALVAGVIAAAQKGEVLEVDSQAVHSRTLRRRETRAMLSEDRDLPGPCDCWQCGAALGDRREYCAACGEPDLAWGVGTDAAVQGPGRPRGAGRSDGRARALSWRERWHSTARLPGLLGMLRRALTPVS